MSFKENWKAFAHKLGKINTAILMTIFYFTICLIFSLVRLADPLRKKLSKNKEESYWEDYEQKDFELERYYRLS